MYCYILRVLQVAPHSDKEARKGAVWSKGIAVKIEIEAEGLEQDFRRQRRIGGHTTGKGRAANDWAKVDLHVSVFAWRSSVEMHQGG